MYTTLGYLYTQIQPVVVGIGPSNRWNLMYYAKPIKLHKGVDNPVKFKIKNQNQKDVDVTNSTFRLFVVDANTKEQLLSRELTIEDAAKGIINTTITEEDLLDFTAVRYHYAIKMVDSSGNEHPIYVDDNYSASGTMEIFDDAFPKHDATVEVTVGAYNSGIATTSVIETSPKAGVHTVAIYLTGFTGSVTVQGHLQDSSSVSESDYIDIKTETYTTQSGVYYANFTGLFKGIRFKVTKTAGTVDKILYKN